MYPKNKRELFYSGWIKENFNKSLQDKIPKEINKILVDYSLLDIDGFNSSYSTKPVLNSTKEYEWNFLINRKTDPSFFILYLCNERQFIKLHFILNFTLNWVQMIIPNPSDQKIFCMEYHIDKKKSIQKINYIHHDGLKEISYKENFEKYQVYLKVKICEFNKRKVIFFYINKSVYYYYLDTETINFGCGDRKKHKNYGYKIRVYDDIVSDNIYKLIYK